MDPLPQGTVSVEKVETNLNEQFADETEYAFEIYCKKEGQTEFSKVTSASFTVEDDGALGISAKNQVNSSMNAETSPGNYVLDGSGCFYLKDGQKVRILSGVQVHDTIYIKEVSTGNYVTSWTLDGSNATNTDATRMNEFYIADLNTYEVVCTNDWNSADLTITKEVLGKVHEDAVYHVLVEIDGKEFPLEFNGAGEQTISEIPTGLTYTISEADPSDGTYNYQNPQYSINTEAKQETAFILRSVVNDTIAWGAIVVEGSEANAVSGTVSADGDHITITNRCKVDLKITKIGSQSVDENQSFLIHVYRDGTFYTNVVIVGNSSVVLKDLPVDTYSIAEDENWSWRYTATRYIVGEFSDSVDSLMAKEADDESQEVDLQYGNKQILIDNDRTEPYWLSGDSYCSNWWGGVNGNGDSIYERGAHGADVTYVKSKLRNGAFCTAAQ